MWLFFIILTAVAQERREYSLGPCSEGLYKADAEKVNGEQVTLNYRDEKLQGAIFSWAQKNSDIRVYYQLSCNGIIHVKTYLNKMQTNSAGYPRSFLPLGGSTNPTRVQTQEGKPVEVIFGNGDRMLRSENDWSPMAQNCFSEKLQPVLRGSKSDGKQKCFSSIEYQCNNPVLEMEADKYPSAAAYTVVYSKACGGKANAIRLSAAQLVKRVGKKNDLSYAFQNADEAVIKLLPQTETGRCLQQDIKRVQAAQSNSQTTPAAGRTSTGQH